MRFFFNLISTGTTTTHDKVEIRRGRKGSVRVHAWYRSNESETAYQSYFAHVHYRVHFFSYK